MASVGGKKHVKTNDVGRRHSPKSLLDTAAHKELQTALQKQYIRLTSFHEKEKEELMNKILRLESDRDVEIEVREKALREELYKVNAKVTELQSELNERNTHEQNLTTTIKELNQKLKLSSDHEILKENTFHEEMDKLNAKVAALQSELNERNEEEELMSKTIEELNAKLTVQRDREAENNEIITSQEEAFKQEHDKLNAKVTELQSELQTKHFEEKIWYTVFANLTDKIKRLESELEKNIMKESNAKSKVNCKAAESSALKEKRKVIFEGDDA
ncbi:hypothetical protein AC249_AIPGENE7856, partial [Exaiptasia diaphana]